MENFTGLQRFKNNDVWRIEMRHLFYSSFSNREQKKKPQKTKSYLKAKITKRHFNTITLSKDLPRKYFQLPSQQFSKDILTEKKGLMEKKLPGEI